MTVKELIERLSLMPSDALVMVDGYECGVAVVDHAELVRAKMNVNTLCCYGPHELYPDGEQLAAYISSSERGH